jgi:adenosylmethionine-8-amino-7-oxononanoate aminotransferase
MVMAKALSSAYFPISAMAISKPIDRGLVSQSDKFGYFAHALAAARDRRERDRRAAAPVRACA